MNPISFLHGTPMRSLHLILVPVLAISLASCGLSPQPVREPASAVPNASPAVIHWTMPGDENDSWRRFIDEDLNPRLKGELNTTLQITFVPWREYFSVIDLGLAGGQDMDLLWHGPAGVQTWHAQDLILPLDELLALHGRELTAVNPTDEWRHVTVDGQIMGIPTHTPTAETFGTLCVRQDLLEQTGMSTLRTTEDVTSFATELQSLGLCKSPFVPTNIKPYLRMMPGNLTLDLGFMNGWFYVDDSKDEDTVYSLYESDAFQELCRLAEDWNTKGLIPADFLLTPDELIRITTGTGAVWTGAITRAIEQQPTLSANVPDGVLREYLLYPEKPKYIASGGGNVFVIPKASHVPDRTIQLLNWVYRSQENYDFMVLGVKDRDYALNAEGRVRVLAPEPLFPEWMFRNTAYMRFPAGTSEAEVQRILHWDDDAEPSKIFGFHFDQSSVSMQIDRVQTVLAERMLPVQYGYVSYEAHIESVLQELEKAGLDVIHRELQSQFTAWLRLRQFPKAK